MKREYIRTFLKENALDAFLFSSSPSVFYLSGFKSTNAYIIITQEKECFLTDSRYYEKAKQELQNWEVYLIKGNTFKFLKKFLKNLGIKTIGFEKDRVTVEFREKLRAKGIRLKGFSGVLTPLRIRKSSHELAILKEGIKKTDLVYTKVLKRLKPGISELELRGFIVEEIFKAGGLGESFPAIIATGENSAIPHWETSNTRIKNNAPLLIDMGMLWKNYCTDFTRTIYLGKPSKEFQKYFEMVKTAWYLGFEKVKVGTPVEEIDKVIREYFYKKGVLDYFIHATVHGIGIEIHEPPRIFYQVTGKNKNKFVIEEGMVFTIEPGLYFSGKFGIRLENMVLVENGRGLVVSQIPLEIEIIEF